MSRENMGNSSSTKDENKMFGKKDCPICGGVGYVRRERPIADPQFGQTGVV